jgi:hypothetical protein
MIDLTPMRGVRVDPVHRRAFVQGGALPVRWTGRPSSSGSP